MANIVIIIVMFVHLKMITVIRSKELVGIGCHYATVSYSSLQCFDTVGWVAGRASGL